MLSPHDASDAGGIFGGNSQRPALPPRIRTMPQKYTTPSETTISRIRFGLPISACATRRADRLLIGRSWSSSTRQAPPLANTLRRSARLTIPTSLPSCTNGHAFDITALSSIRSAISAESRQFTDVDDVARHDVGLQSVPGVRTLNVFGRPISESSARTTRSKRRSAGAVGAGFGPGAANHPSVTIPTSWRSPSTMGMPLYAID